MSAREKLSRIGIKMSAIVGVASIMMFASWLVTRGATMATGISYLVIGIVGIGYYIYAKRE